MLLLNQATETTLSNTQKVSVKSIIIFYKGLGVINDPFFDRGVYKVSILRTKTPFLVKRMKNGSCVLSHSFIITPQNIEKTVQYIYDVLGKTVKRYKTKKGAINYFFKLLK